MKAAPSMVGGATLGALAVMFLTVVGVSGSRAFTDTHAPVCVDNETEIETGQVRVAGGPFVLEDIRPDETVVVGPGPAGSVGEDNDPSERIPCWEDFDPEPGRDRIPVGSAFVRVKGPGDYEVFADAFHDTGSDDCGPRRSIGLIAESDRLEFFLTSVYLLDESPLEDGSARFRLTVWEHEGENCSLALTGCAFFDESAPGGCSSGIEETDWMEGWDGLLGDPSCHRPDLVFRRNACGMQRMVTTLSYYYEIEAQACDGDGSPCFGPVKFDSGCIDVDW